MVKKKKVAKVSPNKSAAIKKKKPAPEAAVSTAATGELVRVAKAAPTKEAVKKQKAKAEANVKAMAKKVDGPKAKPGKQAKQKETRLDVMQVIDLEETETTGQIYLRLLDRGQVVLVPASEAVLEDLIEACNAALEADQTDQNDEEEDDTEDEDVDDE